MYACRTPIICRAWIETSKYKVTEEQYDQILTGDMPFYDGLIAEADSLSINEAETDYAVADDAGRTIIDWNR